MTFKSYPIFLLVFSALFFCMEIVNAQEKRPKDPVAFGVEISPIIPSNLFRITATEMQDDNFQVTRTPNSGFKAAAMIRFGLSGKFAMQTGIGYIRRHFTLDAQIDDIKLEALKVRAINYEIPLGATYYVHLTPEFLMSITLGAAANFLPKDIISSNDDILQGTIQRSWVTPSFFLNYGFEYRTKDYGFFYLGFSYNIFILNMYDNEVVYDYNGPAQKTVVSPIRGDYFGILIRYFFPVDGWKNL